MRRDHVLADRVEDVGAVEQAPDLLRGEPVRDVASFRISPSERPL